MKRMSLEQEKNNAFRERMDDLGYDYNEESQVNNSQIQSNDFSFPSIYSNRMFS